MKFGPTGGKVFTVRWTYYCDIKKLEVEDMSLNFEAFLGHKLVKRMISFIDYIHPEDREAFIKELNRAKKYGDECTHSYYRFFDPEIGRIYYLYDHKKVLEVSDDGKKVTYQGFLFDNTYMMEKKHSLALILEGSNLGLWDWFPQTNKVTFDERWAEILGHELSEIEFSLDSWEKRIHPDDLEDCYNDIRNHIEGRTDFYENVHRMKHKDGRWVYILDRGKIVERDEQGNPTRFLGTHLDITKEKENQEKLVEEMKGKENFFALIGHELKTPLNAMVGFSRDLIEEIKDKSKVEKLEYIEESAINLSDIINDILDYSKLNSGDFKLTKQALEVLPFIEELTYQFEKMAAKKNIGLKVSKVGRIPSHIQIDALRLEQILRNLISNAIKYTRDDIVEVQISARNERLIISVLDNGIGIAKENIEKIFSPFTQIDKETMTRSQGGTGLGLTISRSLAQKMNGELNVLSHYGHGSTFTVDIPILKEKVIEKKVDSHAFKSLESYLSYDNIRVLLVEDNVINQKVATNFLTKIGCVVDNAVNGRDAVQKTVKNEYDLIFMDLQMPLMGGIEATLKIKELLGEEAPPIVALTANTMDSDREGCFNVGMVDFIAKPFSKKSFKKVLDKYIVLNEFFKQKAH